MSLEQEKKVPVDTDIITRTRKLWLVKWDIQILEQEICTFSFKRWNIFQNKFENNQIVECKK